MCQLSALDQAAEFFLGDVVGRAFTRDQIRDVFVADRKSFAFNDAIVVIALLPDLSLY